MRIKRTGIIGFIALYCILASSCSPQESPEPYQEILPKVVEYPVERIEFFEKSLKEDIYLENEYVGGMKESDVVMIIKDMASKIDVEAQNPKVDQKTWAVLGREKAGRKVNVEKTRDSLFNANERARLKLVVEDVKPAVTVEKYKKNVVQISEFTTPLIDNQRPRVKNIQLASQKIDYKKLAPGEEFSFNAVVGRRSAEKGYEEAPVIVKTEEGYESGRGIGGGICQVSTTIFNAVSKVNMQITERNIHSKDVRYVAKGQDATVSYDGVDFKFRNNRNHTVMLRIYIYKNNLTVKVIENRNM